MYAVQPIVVFTPTRVAAGPTLVLSQNRSTTYRPAPKESVLQSVPTLSLCQHPHPASLCTLHQQQLAHSNNSWQNARWCSPLQALSGLLNCEHRPHNRQHLWSSPLRTA
jgi:hypothetical protein